MSIIRGNEKGCVEVEPDVEIASGHVRWEYGTNLGRVIASGLAAI